MIGDWVQTPNGCRKVEELSSKNVIIEWHDYGCTMEDVLPIPLTKEILEKNGFELREGCSTAWDWHDGEQSVYISGEHTCPVGQTVTIYTPDGCTGAAFSSHRTLSDHKIRGVHELQHILRMLGIEKEIKL